MSVRSVVERRRRERQELLDRARVFADQLDPSLGVRAVVVFGSVARGDFNLWSDVDVLVVADHLPAHPVERLRSLGARPGGVEPVAWTPTEWVTKHRTGNPIIREALEAGVWIVGTPDRFDDANRGPTSSSA